MSWFKFWSGEYLNDETINKLDLEDQGAYVRLLCVANGCMDNGYFTFNGKVPLNEEQIINLAGIKRLHWQAVTIIHDRIQFDKERKAWHIKAWKHWQSEYQRQKGYRQKLQEIIPKKVTPKGTSVEVEVDVEREDINRRILDTALTAINNPMPPKESIEEAKRRFKGK
jgi:hypothetical protein